MREICFVLLPQLVLLDLAGPAEAFRLAARAVPGSYTLRFLSPRRELRAAIGLELAQLEPLPQQLAPGTMLVLLGVSGVRVPEHDPDVLAVVEWLRAGAARDATLLCVCAGSIVAARAGLLASRECTTHHAHINELREVEPTARVYDNRIFVEDGSVWTSAGVTAGLDLALHVIGQQLGARVAVDVARDLVVYLRRAAADPALSPWVQHRNHMHPAVHRVQEAVSRQPAARWSARELAAVACTSARNLARLFAEHARCSPLDYVQLIRYAFARELVMQTQLDLEKIAMRAGFSSAQQLRRVWSRWESRPPREFRAAALPAPARAAA
ncbi:MAG: helix-turn-helix domain-containing protein [Sinobacteraceae bacterium]|nr:helix-turn-helix domain-containing protein [Nevskiaceae bacterium]